MFAIFQLSSAISVIVWLSASTFFTLRIQCITLLDILHSLFTSFSFSIFSSFLSIRKCTTVSFTLSFKKLLHTKPFLPSVLNVFVDAASDTHGQDSIVPGGDEHERETQAHSQKGQGPAAENTHAFITVRNTADAVSACMVVHLKTTMSGFPNCQGRRPAEIMTPVQKWSTGRLDMWILGASSKSHC